MRMEEKVAGLLVRQKKSLAVAESCSGGLLTHRLTNVPGSSRFFKLGIVAYSNAAKEKILKIPSRMIKQRGAVSQPVAERMAQNVRALQNTDFGIAITGIAGPTGGTASKPVGLIYIAISTKLETLCLQYFLKGTRRRIKDQASTLALRLLSEFLK